MDDNGGDVISRLPRDLLISILSRLTLKQAMVTSVLSRHWEKLWTFYHGTVDIEVSKKLKQDGCSCYNHNRLMNKVIDAFEQVESGAILDSFKIRLFPGNFQCIDRLVHFALEKKRVNKLSFDSYFYFNCSHYSHDYSLAYDFPPLWHFHPRHRNNIQTLTSIHFKRVNVSGETIGHFLSNCPLLQRLDLIESREALIHLRISGETLALRHLLIHDCHDLTTIELSAPNLLSLCYQIEGIKKVKFDVGNVPKLVEFALKICSTCPHLTDLALRLFAFSYIQKLKLHICCEEPGDLTQLTELTLVKHLIMKFDGSCCERILAWTPLLKAFPLLQKLTIDMFHIREDRIEGLTGWHETFPHKHLKEFEFFGFGKSSDDIELVAGFLKKAATLEKIHVHCNVGESLNAAIICHMEKAARLVKELKRIIPKEVESIIIER